MKEFIYTETATLKIDRLIQFKAEDENEALEMVNEIMSINGFNPDTDVVIDFKTDLWSLKEYKDEGYTTPKFEPAEEHYER